jgi:hypothetical protein
MSTAKQEREAAARDEGPLGKAADDEPVFVLRAQDRFASSRVRDWAFLCRGAGVSEVKIKEALELSYAMDRWPTKKIPD